MSVEEYMSNGIDSTCKLQCKLSYVIKKGVVQIITPNIQLAMQGFLKPTVSQISNGMIYWLLIMFDTHPS